MGGKSSRIVDFRDYTHSGYWRGPYGILVPNNIGAVLSEDQTNYVIRPGHLKTNAYTPKKPLSKEEYMSKYSTKYFAEDYFQSSEKIEKELSDHRLYTKNRRGKDKVYIRMNNGEIYRETKRGVKTIKPISYKR